MEQTVLLIYAAAVVIPFGQLLRRTGLSRWWILLSFIPIINVVALWIFAYCKWPIDNAAVGTDAISRDGMGDAAALATAQHRATLAEERLSELKAILEDVRFDRDGWRDQAQRLALPKAAERREG
jgi:hypothetical protein